MWKDDAEKSGPVWNVSIMVIIDRHLLRICLYRELYILIFKENN
jgi:hypothetical protein